MSFIDPSDVSRIAPIVLQASQLPSTPKETIGLYEKVLTSMCRELEKLVHESKSVRAQENATISGLGNFSDYAWADQPS
jgi:hypothetical protein